MSEDTIKRSDAAEVVYKALKTPPIKGVLTDTMSLAIALVRDIPSADRPQKVVAQITFDEEKLREIVKEAVERFKEEYEITDRPQGERTYLTDIVDFGRCNNCKALWNKSLIDNIYFKYCPRCGARMFAKDINVPNKKGADDERP